MSRLIIVGGGNAGLAAAVRSSQLGMSTVLIEKTDRLGGQLHWSSGHFSAAGTRRQRQSGIEDHPDLHFQDVLRIGHGRNDLALVRLAVNEAAATVDWLEALGLPFGSDTPAVVTGHELYSRPRTYWAGEDPRTGGLPLMETLIANLNNDVVEVRTATTVHRLLTNGEPGRFSVRGVEIGSAAGHEDLVADVVILATGGYAANRSLVETLQPEYRHALTGCLDHATGDGHRMLSALGVDMTHSDTYIPTMGMIPDPDRPGFGLRLSDARVVVDPHQRLPWEIWLNRRGERFVAEDATSPFVREQALMMQPDLTMFVIWDSGVRRSAEPPIGPAWTWDRLESEAAALWLHRADDLKGLTSRLELPHPSVEATLAAYRRDTDPFGRKHRPVPLDQPPYYGVVVVGGMLLSRGGPRVDSSLRPLDGTLNPIEGLYAIGELLGMGRFSGDSFAGGMSVGPALSFGRWVVDQIAGASP